MAELSTEKQHLWIPYLTTYAQEHYAHARDHEHLRAQITTILVAGAFVFIGLGVEKDLEWWKILLPVFVLTMVNWRVVSMHNNRFKRHVEMGHYAMKQMRILSKDKEYKSGILGIVEPEEEQKKGEKEPANEKLWDPNVMGCETEKSYFTTFNIAPYETNEGMLQRKIKIGLGRTWVMISFIPLVTAIILLL